MRTHVDCAASIASANQRSRTERYATKSPWIRLLVLLATLAMVMVVFEPLVTAARASDDDLPEALPDFDSEAALPADLGADTIPDTSVVERSDDSPVQQTAIPPPGNVTSVLDPIPPTIAGAARSTGQPYLNFAEDSYGWTYESNFGDFRVVRRFPAIIELMDPVTEEIVAQTTFTIRSGSRTALPLGFDVSASNRSFRATYPVGDDLSMWGTFTYWFNFTTRAPPKLTFSFQPGHALEYRIVWTTLTEDRYLDSGNGVLDLSVQTTGMAIPWQSTKAEVGDGQLRSQWHRRIKLDWSEAGRASLSIGPVDLTDGQTGYGLIVAFAPNRGYVDPSFQFLSDVYDATEFPNQRKIVTWDGYYYLFFQDFCHDFCYGGTTPAIWYASSRDGRSWSAPSYLDIVKSMVGFDVASLGSLVAVAYIAYSGSYTGSMNFVRGHLNRGAIEWYLPVTQVSGGGAFYSPTVAIGANGIFWVGYVSWDTDYRVTYLRSNKPFDPSSWTFKVYDVTDNANDYREAVRPLALSNGTMILLSYNAGYTPTRFRYKTYDPWADSTSGWNYLYVSLRSGSSLDSGRTFSATVDWRDIVNIVYEDPSSTILVTQIGGYDCGSWNLDTGAVDAYPTIGLDLYHTLHVYWIDSSGYIVYSRGDFYSDVFCPVFSDPLYPIGSYPGAAWLTSAEHSVASAPFVFTQILANQGKVWFGSVPSPTDLGPIQDSPWSRPGLSPYESYFQNLGEAVSPGNGLLVVRQEDLSLPGRGIDLTLARIYVEPLVFAGGTPYLFEQNPDAPMGTAWTLDLPRVGTEYLHLWGGQTYRIYWNIDDTGLSGSLGDVFENHLGEQFRLERQLTASPRGGYWVSGYILTTPSGDVYNFDSAGSVTSITDASGQSRISFSYTMVGLNTITDTIGRVVNFVYTNGRLTSLSLAGKTIASYGYTGNSLSTVTDADSRTTRFWYTPNRGGWLLEGILYPTGGRSIYTYNTGSPIYFGPDAVGYPVSSRTTRNASNATQWSTSFGFESNNGRVLFANVTLPDTTYTEYDFYHTGIYSTVTRYALPRTQLGRARLWATPAGMPVRTDTYNGASALPSYSTESLADEWGNVIYTKDAQGHASFVSFDGETLQNTFTGAADLKKVTDGKVLYENFDSAGSTVPWGVSGTTVSLDRAVYDPVPPSLKLRQTIANAVAGAYKYFPAAVGSGNLVVDLHFKIPYRVPFPGTSAIYAISLEDSGSAPVLRPAIQENSIGYMALGYLDAGSTFTACMQAPDMVLADVWHRLTIVVNLTGTRVFNPFLDGVRPGGCKDLPLLANLNALDRIELQTWYAGGSTSVTLWVDEVKVASGAGIEIRGLRPSQTARLLDPVGARVAEARATPGASSTMLNTIYFDYVNKIWCALEIGPDTLLVYDSSGNLDYQAPFHEFFGGTSFQYTKPFEVTSLARVEAGFSRPQTMLLDDDANKPSGTYVGAEDGWTWRADTRAPVAGSQFHVGAWNIAMHQHYFTGASLPTPSIDDYFVQFVRISNGQYPAEIMLQFNSGTSWEHRAYWGSNLIAWGTNGYPSRLPMGAIPYAEDRWVMLIVKAGDVAMSGASLNGLSYTLYGGEVMWDASVLGDRNTGNIRVSGLASNQLVQLTDAAGNLITSAFPSGDTAQLWVYNFGVNAFPFPARIKVYDIYGALQYTSPVMDVYGGDRFGYTPPDFYLPGVGASIHDRPVGTMAYLTTSTMSPVLHLDMELSVAGQYRDASFSGNHAVASGSPSQVNGIVGNALRFNGSTSYLTSSDSVSLDIPNEITIGLWVFLDQDPNCDGNNNWRSILTKRSSSGNDFGSYYAFLEDDRAISWSVTVGGARQAVRTPAGAIPLQVWTHLWMTRTSDGVMKVYVNGGTPYTQSTTAGGIDPSDGSFAVLRVGAGSNTGSCPAGNGAFPGIIDELTVYDHAIPVEDAAIQYWTQLYSGGQPLQKAFVKYNSNGRAVEAKTFHNNRWIISTAAYDVYGNLNSTRDPLGHSVYYSYSDFYGKAYPTKVTETVSGRAITSARTYDYQRGWLLSEIAPNGLRTRYSYDVVGRLVNTSAFPPLPSSAGLYFDMETPTDETPARMRDLSGHANNGQLVGTSTVPGRTGNARSFNGNSDYLSVADSPSLQSSTFSVAFWINPASFPTGGGYTRVVAKDTYGAGGLYRGWMVLFDSSQPGKIYMAVFANSPSFLESDTPRIQLTNGTWQHVAFTFDGTNLRGFLNGVEVTPAGTMSGTYGLSTNPLLIGTGDGSGFYSGLLDEVYVFSGAISTGDIRSLYLDSYGMYSAVTVQYDDAANTATSFDENGHKTRQVFDFLGRLTERDRYDAAGLLYSYTNYTLDWRNLVTGYGTDNRSVFVYTYDKQGRLTKVQSPGSASRTWAYVDATLTGTTTATDEVGRIRKTETFYATGAPKAVSEWNPATSSWNVTSYVYNGLGHLISATDPNGGYTRHDYDDTGRLVRTTFPDGIVETYVYDDNDNLYSKVDRAGRTTEFVYDEAGRLKKQSQYQASQRYDSTFSYDVMGNLLISDNVTARSYARRDLFGRALLESIQVGSSNLSTSYGYDRTGNVLYIVYPSGTNVSYQYDAFNRPTDVKIGGAEYASLSYRRDDLVSLVWYYNGGTTPRYNQAQIYDDRGRPLQITVGTVSKNSFDLRYLWTAASDVRQITDAIANKVETYAYDGQDRLSSATGPWGSNGASLSLAYTYDAKGNWLTKKEGTTTTYFVYDAAKKDDRLCGADTTTGKTCTNAATRFTYDQLGQMATRTSGSTTTTYTFDMSGLLVKLTVGGASSSYAYDALGRRVKSVEGSTTTYFAFAGPNILYTKSGSTGTDYVYAAGLLILRKSGNEVRYYHADHLGNIRLVTYWGSNQVKTEYSARYKPFGETVVVTDNSKVKMRFTGEWLDPTGLYYLRARYYDPTIGRFLSQDPTLGHLSRPQTLNRYTYVVNNPLRFVDPSGLDGVPWWLDVITLGLASEIPKTIDWWNRASDAERWGFIAGILTAVIIGIAIGVSCVVAACVGLVLVAAGSAAFLGGSVGASIAYVGVTRALGGTPTQEGLSHVFYWGGWAGLAGFGIGQAAGRALGLGGKSYTRYMTDAEYQRLQKTGELKFGKGDVYATSDRVATNAELRARGGIVEPKQWGVRFRPEVDTFRPNGLAKFPRGNPLEGLQIPNGISEYISNDPVLIRTILEVWPIA